MNLCSREEKIIETYAAGLSAVKASYIGEVHLLQKPMK